jgi:hypothetical protein
MIRRFSTDLNTGDKNQLGCLAEYHNKCRQPATTIIDQVDVGQMLLRSPESPALDSRITVFIKFDQLGSSGRKDYQAAGCLLGDALIEKVGAHCLDISFHSLFCC